jgi:hypothetical protein
MNAGCHDFVVSNRELSRIRIRIRKSTGSHYRGPKGSELNAWSRGLKSMMAVLAR